MADKNAARDFARKVIEKTQPEGTDGSYIGGSGAGKAYAKPTKVNPDDGITWANAGERLINAPSNNITPATSKDNLDRAIAIAKVQQKVDNFAVPKAAWAMEHVPGAAKVYDYMNKASEKSSDRPRDGGELSIHAGNDLHAALAKPGNGSGSVDYLYEPQGAELHWEGLKKAQEPTDKLKASLSGSGSPPGLRSSMSESSPKTSPVAQAMASKPAYQPHQMTPDELLAYAKNLQANTSANSEAQLGAGASTGDVDASGNKLPSWLEQYKSE